MNRYAQKFTRDSFADTFDEDWVNDPANANLMANADPAMAQASMEQALIRQEQYYFRRSERSFAKAERYRRLSQNDAALRAHAEEHGNRSASKRAKKARNASKAYKRVARLQTAYEKSLESRSLHDRSLDESQQGGRFEEAQRGNWKAITLEDYTRLEEITRARIEALTFAAQAKSISKHQEEYSIQRGTLKNLLILRDSLNRLLREKSGQPEERQLNEKLLSLNKEIDEAKTKTDQLASRAG